MLDSERVQTLPIEARWLYVSILLMADDVGLFEVNAFQLGRRAALDQVLVPKLILSLIDADLIRTYSVAGKTYGFIPRYGQRIQIKRARHPLPPASIAADDLVTVNKINDLAANPPCITVTHRETPSEPEPEEEQEKEPTVLVVCKADNAYRVPDCPYESLTSSYHEHCPTMPRLRVMTNMRQKHMRARWVEVASTDKLDQRGALDWFVWFFKRASASPFLSGRVTRGKDSRVWKADFEWLMTAGNFAKVIEGRYHEEAA